MSEIPKDLTHKLPVSKTQKILSTLPDYLKNPAHFERIKKEIYDILQSKHSHADILEWFACKDCKSKIREYREFLNRLGFRSPAHYMVWQKTHTKIREMYPLVDWKIK